MYVRWSRRRLTVLTNVTICFHITIFILQICQTLIIIVCNSFISFVSILISRVIIIISTAVTNIIIITDLITDVFTFMTPSSNIILLCKSVVNLIWNIQPRKYLLLSSIQSHYRLSLSISLSLSLSLSHSLSPSLHLTLSHSPSFLTLLTYQVGDIDIRMAELRDALAKREVTSGKR